MSILKQLLSGALYTILFLFLITGCKDENYNENNEDTNTDFPVSIYNEIFQVATTRVNDNGFCDKDAVGVYVVDYVNNEPGALKPQGNRADNVKFTFNEDGNKWIPSEDIYFKDKYTPVDLFGYYPFATPEQTSAYEFELAKDQNKPAENGQLSGYEASDFLWAKAERIAPTAQRIPLLFYHKMACIRVELTEGIGFADGEWANLEKDVLIMNTTRNSVIDLATGVVSPIGDVNETGTIPYKDGATFRAIIVPQQVKADLSLFYITVDNTAYKFRKEDIFTYEPGKLHKFTISVSKKSGSGLSFEVTGESISAWETDPVSHDANSREYIIIHCPEGGKLKESIIEKNGDFTKIKNLKVTGYINEADFVFMNQEMVALQALNLKEVRIVDYSNSPLDAIPSMAFFENKTLSRFVFPDRLKQIGENAFSRSSLTGSLIIPEGVVEIGPSAFLACKNLSGTLSLPKATKKIGNSAFYQCSGFIGTLVLPINIKEIEHGAFTECSGFSGNLILPESLEHIGSFCFFQCTGFTGDLKIPSKIKHIGEGLFNYCRNLNGRLHLPSNLISIESYAFNFCSFKGELIIPESVVSIGEYVFAYNQFSGNLHLPKELKTLQKETFAYNYRLDGIISIPDEIVSIGERCFAECSNIEGVILPKGLEGIQSAAFENCFQLNSIVSKALNPPYLNATSFNGVAKDNFTVEVPEYSVANYQTAPVWNEFKRFSANRDFSISRSLLRTLNKGETRQLIIRALSGANWSIEKKPDWVTVSPTSGTGKTEVTIRVDAMPHNNGNREDEIVFLLDEKNYRTRLKVEQYDYVHNDGDVLTLQTAGKGKGVDLVFMGDCFDAKDIHEGKYLNGINTAIEHFFAVEPYKSYRDYFNVHVVFGQSTDSGIGSVNTIRESCFGSSYSLHGVKPDELTCFDYAQKAPLREGVHRTLITMVLNTSDYGGICYMWGDGSAIACCPMTEDYYPYDYRGIVQHEAGGHGFGKLGDEYIYHNDFIQTCYCGCCGHVSEFNASKNLGWYDNLSLNGSMIQVPWSHLFYHPKYADNVDIYEGGYMHMRGVFRSEPNSCMNNNIPYFSAISRESIVKRIKEYAGEKYSFDEFVANDIPESTQKAMRSPDKLIIPGKFSNRQHAPVFMGQRPNLKK